MSLPQPCLAQYLAASSRFGKSAPRGVVGMRECPQGCSGILVPWSRGAESQNTDAEQTQRASGEYLTPSIKEVLQQLLEVQATLHLAGTVSADALSAIATHASKRPIRNSVETGCGATTLLLSHLSENHKVFALDIGNSISSVRRSTMLRPGVVTFMEGPSQRTLPKHHFSEKLQLALIDGPHAYPFPDLEYYFLYPHLDTGALLILDDIQIRTITISSSFCAPTPCFGSKRSFVPPRSSAAQRLRPLILRGIGGRTRGTTQAR
jgi:hypothetical protein